MRAFLVFVILVLLGLLGATWYFKTRPTEAHRQIIAELKEDLDEAHEEQSRLREELVRAKAELDRHGGVPEKFAPATPAASNSGRPAAQGPLDQRLAELKAIYDQNLATIEKERSEAERVLAETTAQHRELANTEFKFAEQSVVTTTDSSGIMTSRNRGVRTSQADRDRAHKLRQEKLDEFDAKIKKASETIAGLDERRTLLDQQYRNAVSRARADSTGSGR